MKIIVTHSSPDMDAIASVWLIRKFLPGWEDAIVRFVPAGERLTFRKTQNTQISGVSDSQIVRQSDSPSSSEFSEVIDKIEENEVIHVDTGLGPLDHHQTADDKVCAASLTWDFVRRRNTDNRGQRSEDGRQKTQKEKDREEAVSRMVKVVVDTDHFKEVFWPNPTADHYEFSVGAMLDGLKLAKPNQDEYYVSFVSECLDAILHEFENRIWAEKEIAENGQKFETRFGKGMGFETINDSVIKLSQKMGYVIVVRKDSRKGYVRVKARPSEVEHRNVILSKAKDLKNKRDSSSASGETQNDNRDGIDLTLAYEKLKKMDPEATWFLHIGKKMLLNGSVKNPKMRPTSLGLGEIIKVLEKI